ncbi:sulfite exporter TauE/SafE family protein [Pseudoclavibacter sp. 8L]|uniref:sulfite exporter TauE/SafE family protein n=1 Tax=Pseudoclavibacter sp. 8L TaxID=2653162 RepID=UPI0012F08BB5|nr:sulfite exporter TauE/SafE family protein [Pseudoclavibacter sp. 8L]VXC16618.1 putative membrane transporter protein [Pseudoclavibacter sp. 8L]
MTPAEWVALVVIFLAASCLQAGIGFGMGMLAAPFIALIDPALLPATVIIMSILLTSIVTVAEKDSLDLRGAGWALVGRVPGSVAGALLVTVMAPAVLSWVVVATVVTGVVFSLRGWAPKVTRWSQIVAGAASGVMGTTTSIGGAPMAIIWQGSDSARLRGTLSAFLLVGSIISFGLLVAFGAVAPQTWLVVVWMIPVVLLGFVASRFITPHLDKTRTKRLALGASLLGCALLVVTQLVQLLA